MNNPIVQTLGIFVGASSLLMFLVPFGRLDMVATAIAGIFTVVLWMLRYDRVRLYSLYRNPVAGPIIDLVCKVAQEQPPVDATTGSGGGGAAGTATPAQQEQDPILLRTPAQFAAAQQELKETVLGQDLAVDGVMETLSGNMQLRGGLDAKAVVPPLGFFLLVGTAGLGKRRLATELGHRLYRNGAIITLDLAEHRDLGALVSAVKTNPYALVVLENLDAASPEVQRDLRVLGAGAPLVEAATGAKVSFRQCTVFLLLNREADSLPRPAARKTAGTGQTKMVDALTQELEIDQQLAWTLQGTFPFLMPTQEDQAHAVLQLMEAECRRYNVELGYVDPRFLAREVEVASTQKGFQLTAARVAKVMRQPIIDAVRSGARTVDARVDDEEPAAEPEAEPAAEAPAERAQGRARSLGPRARQLEQQRRSQPAPAEEAVPGDPED